jgi:hypothetical protein
LRELSGTQPDQPLAEILAAIKLGDGARAILDAVDDILECDPG